MPPATAITTDKTDPAKADSAAAKSEPADKAPGLYAIVFTNPYGGGTVCELHPEETASSRVSERTWGSKQHRKEAADNDEELPDGGGAHELNRKDIHVYRLGATPVTDF